TAPSTRCTWSTPTAPSAASAGCATRWSSRAPRRRRPGRTRTGGRTSSAARRANRGAGRARSPRSPCRSAGWRGCPACRRPPRRRPRQFAPYHLRLDWLMWFAALSPAYAEPWFGRLVERLLAGDRDTLRLLRASPFPPDAPPRYVRARLFRYRFSTRRELRETGAWWQRTYVRDFLPPTRLADG